MQVRSYLIALRNMVCNVGEGNERVGLGREKPVLEGRGLLGWT
jgi:hypothetical protein